MQRERFDNCPTLRARFVADISKRFPTEDKGELEWILNTAITRDRAARTLNLSQGLYAADLVTKFSAYFDRSRSRRFDSPWKRGSNCPPMISPPLDLLNTTRCPSSAPPTWPSSADYCGLPI